MSSVRNVRAVKERFQCAEAIVEIRGDLVYKRRIEKRYRVKELDTRFRDEFCLTLRAFLS